MRTNNGNIDKHQGSFRLGLTSGSFYIGGPISKKTTYSIAARRSWFELLTLPLFAITNSINQDNKTDLGYAFMDINAKVTHRFTSRTTCFLSVYYGQDYFKYHYKDTEWQTDGVCSNEKSTFNWGNLVAQINCNHKFTDLLSAEFTAAFTNYFSSIHNNVFQEFHYEGKNNQEWISASKVKNDIKDIIVRADFDWTMNKRNRFRFGFNYTAHCFLPATSSRYASSDQNEISWRDSTDSCFAEEAHLYIEDDIKIGELIRLNTGLNLSLFRIQDKTEYGFGPRLSFAYRPLPFLSFKVAYSRTNQYVRQLSQSFLSLPIDQWVPITGDFKPETADKLSLGVYWSSRENSFNAAIEGYYKSVKNLIDYKDDYYLLSPLAELNSRLCSGAGSAKGIDMKIEKKFGAINALLSYSLSWAYRQFPDKNNGLRYPARFNNRHSIKISFNWAINDKIGLNALWIGHSGNRVTLLTQSWSPSNEPSETNIDEVPLKAWLNNYQLPFYHRLDISCIIRNRHGYLTFGLFNAYCHMNTIGIRRSVNREGKPVFQKVKLLPIIPSISYTWQF